MTLREELESGLSHQQAGRLAEAEGIYRGVLARHPDHVDALHLLGILEIQRGGPEKAVDLIGRAIRVKPDFAGAHANLGIALVNMGQIAGAIAAFREAVRLKPGLAELHVNLGNVLKRNGQLGEAIASFREAVRFKPDIAEMHNCLAIGLKSSGQLAEAAVEFGEVIRLSPDNAAAHANLGNVQNSLGRFDEAIASFRESVRLKPDLAVAQNNLGSTFREIGRLDEAIAAYRQAIRVKPDYAAAHSNLIYTVHFHPGYDNEMIHEELRCWKEQHADGVERLIESHTNNRDPERCLRIGYVSADFYDHPSALFLLPLFRHHDRQRFELFCYSESERSHEVTGQMRRAVDHWRGTEGLTDAAAAEMVRKDQIDILVDLKLHTSGNRLLVFARKPAPVQVSWLGYPGSTGLRTIDYRITDPYLEPRDFSRNEEWERVVHLPETFWCYDPLEREIAVNAPPCVENGFVTFGCLNSFCKVNEQVLRLWARILKTVDRSRLIILCPEGSNRQSVMELFQSEGIHSDRIELAARRPRRQYLQLYHRIDVGLDTFPYNGHTTSLDSFWMGVPVVTLAGKTLVGRGGLSQLSNLGLTELIAQTPQQYVEIADHLAKDLNRLVEIRGTLRSRMESSPLMDAPRFARNMEAAYREMWRNWCAGGGDPKPSAGI